MRGVSTAIIVNTPVPDDQLPRWNPEGDKLLGKLLYEMSRVLGHAFDEVQLRRNVYSPVAHGRLESEEVAIRAGLAKVLSSQQAVPVVRVSGVRAGEGAPRGTGSAAIDALAAHERSGFQAGRRLNMRLQLTSAPSLRLRRRRTRS